MNKWKNVTAVAIAIGVLGTSAFAQKETEKKTKEKSQEIIIRKDGNKNEKMTIVVDGDNITINGKPIDKLTDADVHVYKRDGRAEAPRVRAFATPGGEAFRSQFNGSDVFTSSVGNKAMLGVVTTQAEGGAKITEITDESGADKAGLKVDDIITKVGDKKIENSNDLIAAIGTHKPNDKVDVTFKRNGKEAKISATLGESKARTFSMNGAFDGLDFPGVASPFGEGFTYNRKPKVGLQIMDVEEGTGVQIRDVDDESAASKAGLKEGDVITEVNGKAVAGVDAMKELIKDLKEGDSLKVTYRRGGNTQNAEVKIPKRLKTANL